MTFSFIGATVGFSTSAPSAPAGVQAGDLLLFQCTAGPPASTVDVPGWARVLKDSGGTNRHSFWFRVASGDSNDQIQDPHHVGFAGSMAAYRGFKLRHATTDWAEGSTPFGGGNAALPSLATGGAAPILVSFVMANDPIGSDTVTAWSPSLTVDAARLSDGGNWLFWWAHALRVSSPTVTATMTDAGTVAFWGAVLSGAPFSGLSMLV